MTSPAAVEHAERVDPAAPPDAAALVALARRRLAAELETLPQAMAAIAHLCGRAAPGDDTLSPGALVHLLRRATAAGEAELAQTLFLRVIERVERTNAAWARRTLAATPAHMAPRHTVDDLLQELTLSLWTDLALKRDEAWELFFWRALDFAQRRVASDHFAHLGSPRPVEPGKAVTLRSSLLGTDAADTLADTVPAPDDGFSAAELADLRALVLRLPHRERIAVVLRFWHGAGERDIATALGGVTTRTVRNILRRAYARLAHEWAGEEWNP